MLLMPPLRHYALLRYDGCRRHALLTLQMLMLPRSAACHCCFFASATLIRLLPRCVTPAPSPYATLIISLIITALLPLPAIDTANSASPMPLLRDAVPERC